MQIQQSLTHNSNENFTQLKTSIQEASQNLQGYLITSFSNVQATVEKWNSDIRWNWFKYNYSLSEMIERVNTASQNNQKICLFIGRKAHEPLPAEEGCLWISGDVGLSEKICDLSHRIHLQLDFTDEKQLKILSYLFDKIVIDQSTCKYMNGDFISRFNKLLKPNNASQLIFERTPYMGGAKHIPDFVNKFSDLEYPINYSLKDGKRSEEIYTQYKQHTSLEVQEADKQTFEQLKAEKATSFKNFNAYIVEKIREETGETPLVQQGFIAAQEDTDRHTHTFFENVVVFNKSTFPYPTNYSRPGQDRFVIATGPKV